MSRDEAIKLTVKSLLEVVQTGAKNIEISVMESYGKITVGVTHVNNPTYLIFFPAQSLDLAQIEEIVAEIEREKEAGMCCYSFDSESLAYTRRRGGEETNETRCDRCWASGDVPASWRCGGTVDVHFVKIGIDVVVFVAVCRVMAHFVLFCLNEEGEFLNAEECLATACEPNKCFQLKVDARTRSVQLPRIRTCSSFVYDVPRIAFALVILFSSTSPLLCDYERYGRGGCTTI